MSAERKNEKNKKIIFKKMQLIFIKILELKGMLIKSKKIPQNVHIAKISKRRPSKKEKNMSAADNSLKNVCDDINNANLAIEKTARKTNTYMPAAFNPNNLLLFKLIYILFFDFIMRFNFLHW
jgi:hypothetical protein